MAAEQVVTTLTIDARGATAGSAEYERAMKVAQAAYDRMLDRDRKAQEAIQKQTAVVTNGAGSISSLARQWDRLSQSVDQTLATERRRQEVLALSDAAVKRLGVSTQEAQRIASLAMRNTANTNTMVAGSFRNVGSAVQQVGFQVGDLAVQIASGQGVLRPLIQQGTQVLQAFGPWGAVIGAAAAVAGALALGLGLLGDESEDAAEKQKKLDEAILAANDNMRTATERSTALAAAKRDEATAILAAALALERENLVRLETERAARQAQEAMFTSGGGPQAQTAEDPRVAQDVAGAQAREALLALRINQLGDTSAERIDDARKAILEFTAAIDPAEAATQKFLKTLEALNTAYDVLPERQDEILGLIVQLTNAWKDEMAALDPLNKARAQMAEHAAAEAEALVKAESAIEEQIKAIRQETADMGLNEIQRFKAVELRKAEAEIVKGNIQDYDGYIARINAEVDARIKLLSARQNAQAIAQQEAITEREIQEAREAENRIEQAKAREVNRAGGLREQAEAAKLSTVEYNELTKSYEVNDRALKIVVETQRIMNQEQSIGIEKARELATANVDAQKQLEKAVQSNEKLAKDLERTITRSTDRAVDLAADTLYDAFSGRIKDVGALLRSVLLRAAAQAAAEMVFRPILAPIIGGAVAAAPGLFGLAGPGGAAAGGVAGAAGGGYQVGLMDIGSVALGGARLGGVGGGVFSGITSFIDEIGYSMGFSAGAFGGANVAAGSAEASLAGFGANSSFLPFSLSEALPVIGSALPGLISGNYIQAGLGAAGAVLGSLTPLGPLGGALGGLIGNIIGGFFGRKKGGYVWRPDNIAASAEQAIGADNVLQGGLGVQARNWNWATLGPESFNTASRSFVTETQIRLADLIAGVGEQYGASFGGLNVGNVAYNGSTYLFTRATDASGRLGNAGNPNSSIFGAGQYFAFDSKDEESTNNAVARLTTLMIANAASVANANVRKAAQAISGRSDFRDMAAEAIAQQLDFAMNFDAARAALQGGQVNFEETTRAQAQAQTRQTIESIEEFLQTTADLELDFDAAKTAVRSFVEIMVGLKEADEPLSDTEQAVERLKIQFEELGPLLEAVGIGADKIPELQQQALNKLRDGFNKSMQDQILAITDPLELALREFDKVAEQRLEDARLLGADMVYVERLNALQRQKIIDDANQAMLASTQRMYDDIQAFLDGQVLGDTSTLSPAAKLAEAQAQFQAAVVGARAGDDDARQRVTGLADTLLRTGLDYYAMSPEYALLERLTRQMLESLLPGGEGSLLDRPIWGGPFPGPVFGGPAIPIGGYPLPGYADGTMFAAGGPSIVGERGMELLNLPRGSQVLPFDRTLTVRSPELVEALGQHLGVMRAELGALRDEIAALKREAQRQTDQRRYSRPAA